MSTSPRFMKRKVRAGKIEVDPNEMAILVHYSVEATVLGADGEAIESRGSENVKKIRLTSLNENSNIDFLAQEIVDKCQLIHASKVGEVKRLCQELQARCRDRSSYHYQQQQLTKMTDPALASPQRGQSSSGAGAAKAQMRKLDEYLEQLYEEVEGRTRATALILDLVQQDPANIESLVGQERLMLALTRVLKEDLGKRGTEELIGNILHFFFIVSQYSQFHPRIQSLQVGRTALRVAEIETERHTEWLAALHEKERAAAEAGSDPAAKAGLEKALRTLRTREQKQERLLFVALHLLLNIAESPAVERKLCNNNISGILASILERRNLELLILVVAFLKKLAIYQENKESMKELHIVERLCGLLGAKNTVLVSEILELLINLGFDAALRAEMVRFGLVSHLGELLGHADHETHALRVLYQISMDEEARPAFAYGGVISKLRERMLGCEERYVPQELMAVAINLALCERTAALFCEDGGFELFVRRVCATGDALLIKFVHNISLHPGDFKLMFLDFVDEIVGLVKDSPSPAFQLEALAILAGLAIDRFNYAKLLEEFALLEVVFPMLQPDAFPDDIALQAVVFMGTIATDAAAADLVARTNVIESLMEMLAAKQEDDAFVLHITYAFYFFALHASTRVVLMDQEHAVVYMIDLLQDRNVHVRRLAAAVLDIVVEHDPRSADQIKRRKFEAHNWEWLQLSEADGGGGGGDPRSGAYGDSSGYDDRSGFHDHNRSFDNVRLQESDLFGGADDPMLDTVDSMGYRDGGDDALYL
eukprot:Amastigsp_a175183_15.p1 type:complete len:770 gc:universal Amastigsp_a175183_15:89-2398(+)